MFYTVMHQCSYCANLYRMSCDIFSVQEKKKTTNVTRRVEILMSQRNQTFIVKGAVNAARDTGSSASRLLVKCCHNRQVANANVC